MNNKSSRSLNSINNAAVSIGSTLIITLLHFIQRRVFVSVLSNEYLGLGGLFSNILSILSLAELGIGHAMNFALYKPIKDGDTEKIKSLMRLYRTYYTIIGLVVLAAGLSLAPFLNFLIKDMPQDIPEIRLYYCLYVLNSASSYFFTYKRALIICDQKEFISTLEYFCISVLASVVRIAILLKTGNYLFYLLVSVFFTLVGNLVISHIAGRLYPYLKEDDVKVLDDDEKKQIRENIGALILHKIGSVVVFSTDNLIISRFLGLVSVGLYSNYTMIINGVKKFIGKLVTSSTASVGNLIASGDRNHCREIMEHMIFANVWLYGFSAICFVCLIPSFVVLWIGEDYLLPEATLIAAAVSFYITGMRQIVIVFKDAAGIFIPDRYKAIVESIANIVFSIPLAIRFGITGVILGTILSTVLVCFWYEAHVFFRDFYGGGTRRYLLYQLAYAAFNAVLCAGVWYVCSFVVGMDIAAFALRFIICLILPNAVYFLLFRKSPHFKYFLEIACRIIKRKKK